MTLGCLKWQKWYTADNRRTGKKLLLHTISFDDVAYATSYF